MVTGRLTPTRPHLKGQVSKSVPQGERWGPHLVYQVNEGLSISSTKVPNCLGLIVAGEDLRDQRDAFI